MKREPHSNPTMVNANGQPSYRLGHNRMQQFGLTMVVMGASFIFYYLGLFGTVDGPLTPENIGAALAALGVTRRHVVIGLLSLLIGALAWNWIFNLVALVSGRRMTCKAESQDADGFCGAPVNRIRRIARRSGQTVVEYGCPSGHLRVEAHFHPLKKGTVGHTLWIACLAFMLIALFGA